MNTLNKILFWSSLIILSFIPGGIFISVFLLSLYYLVPLFLENDSKKEEKETFEFTIPFKVIGISRSDPDNPSMKFYSDHTLEEMK